MELTNAILPWGDLQKPNSPHVCSRSCAGMGNWIGLSHQCELEKRQMSIIPLIFSFYYCSSCVSLIFINRGWEHNWTEHISHVNGKSYDYQCGYFVNWADFVAAITVAPGWISTSWILWIKALWLKSKCFRLEKHAALPYAKRHSIINATIVNWREL